MFQVNDTTDNRLFYKLNIAQRILLKYIDKEINNKLGIPVVQATALFYIFQNNGCLLKDLSAALLQNKSAITTLVERMEKNGLIVKKDSESDGRASQLFLTEKGRCLCTQAQPLVLEYGQHMLEDFSDSEIHTIHRFLDTLIRKYN
jgi:DNA-binding MarR family transcriptional regulator